MSVASRSSDSEELLCIYIVLRKLKCLPPEDYSLFSQNFLWKVLDERLAALSQLGCQICGGLFGEVGASVPAVQTGRSAPTSEKHLSGNQPIRFPEFDVYFHTCLCLLYDLVLDLSWHEPLSPNVPSAPERASVPEHMAKFLAFQESMDVMLRRVRGKRGKTSPTVKRRVQFENPSPPVGSSGANQRPVDQPDRRRTTLAKQDLRDNHSVFALDLMLYGVYMFVQRLASSLAAWSAEVQSDMHTQIDLLFNSKTRIKSRQLQEMTKAIKISNDAHLTVLEHLSEIKKNYLIRTIAGTLLVRDSQALLENYKQPRIVFCLQKLHNEAEVKILQSVTSHSLQILFNLIICEINVPPVELRPTRAQGARMKLGDEKELDKVQQNVMNFIGNWLRVDEILFGGPTSEPRNAGKQDQEGRTPEDPLKRIKRSPLTVAHRNSTLSLSSDSYKSSSRILTQMDNLGEFTRRFLRAISSRLSHPHQLTYFFEYLSVGINEFFDVVASKLEQQLKTASTGPTNQQNISKSESRQQSSIDSNLDSITVKVRCLKFVHIMSSASRIIADEAARVCIRFMGPEERIAKFTSFCSSNQ